MKRDFLKIYDQQRANINDFDQNVEITFDESNIYHQIGKAYLEFDIIVGNPASNFDKSSEIRLINNACAYCFKEVLLSTTGGSDLEDKKFVGQVSTFMRI